MGSNINKLKLLTKIYVMLLPLVLLVFLDTFRVYEYAGFFGLASLGCGFLFVSLFLGLVTKEIN